MTFWNFHRMQVFERHHVVDSRLMNVFVHSGGLPLLQLSSGLIVTRERETELSTHSLHGILRLVAQASSYLGVVLIDVSITISMSNMECFKLLNKTNQKNTWDLLFLLTVLRSKINRTFVVLFITITVHTSARLRVFMLFVMVVTVSRSQNKADGQEQEGNCLPHPQRFVCDWLNGQLNENIHTSSR